LNHFTVPTVMSLSPLRHLGGISQRPRPLAAAAGSMCCSRRPRRAVRRDGHAEYLRGCSQGPNGGCRCATGSVPSNSSRRHLLVPAPTGCAGRPGPPRSVQPMPWPPRPGPPPAGSGPMGLRCSTTIGKRRALLRRALAVSPRSSPTAIWPEANGGLRREPGGSAPVGLRHGSTRWRHLGRPGCCAKGVSVVPARAPSGEAGARATHQTRNPTSC
jgi:hypothetical protein